MITYRGLFILSLFSFLSSYGMSDLTSFKERDLKQMQDAQSLVITITTRGKDGSCGVLYKDGVVIAKIQAGKFAIKNELPKE